MNARKVLKKLAYLANQLDEIGAKDVANSVDQMMAAYAEALENVPAREDISPAVMKARARFNEMLHDITVENVGQRLVPLIGGGVVDDTDELRQLAQDYADELLSEYFDEVDVEPGNVKDEMAFGLAEDVDRWVYTNHESLYDSLQA